MRLTERDYHIMWRLHICGWLSTTQLKREFFQGTTPRAIQKRLRILSNEGFLFCKQPSLTEEYYFKLGSKGKLEVAEKFEMESEQIHILRHFPKQLKHFSTLNDIRWYCENSIIHEKMNLKFFLVDKELKGKLQNSMVIPDALLGFSHSEKGFKRQFIIAIEYDAGTENPQYFGRDKVQKYGNELQVGNPIFSNKGFQVLVFADTRRRIFQLLKHSYKFLQKDLQFFFASMEDLAESGNLFAPIFISPEKSFVTDKLILCSAFE